MRSNKYHYLVTNKDRQQILIKQQHERSTNNCSNYCRDIFGDDSSAAHGV